MNERILNQLKAKRAEKLEEMSALAGKFASVDAKITDEDATKYAELKSEVKTLNSTIADAESQIASEDMQNSVEEVTQPSKNTDFANFIRMGKVSSMTKGVKNIDRTTAEAVVPAEVEKEIRLKLTEESILRKIAKIVQVGSKEKVIPVEGDDITGYWVDEGTDFTEGDTTIESKSLHPYKNGALVKVTTELLEDSVVDIVTYLGYKIAKGLNKNFENTALLNTTDNNKKPLGLVAQATAGVTTDTGAGVITTEDLTSLYYSVKQAYRKQGTWLVSTDAIKLIINLKDENGNRIYYPSLVVGVPDTLLGRPVYEVEDLGDLSVDTFPVIFGDFSKLEIGERKGITLRRLNEIFAGSGKIGFIAEERIDSVLIHDEAIKTLKIGAIPTQG